MHKTDCSLPGRSGGRRVPLHLQDIAFSMTNNSAPAKAAVVKAALAGLSQVAAAADPRDWPAAAPAFGLLLSLAMDARPKVRRRAQSGLLEVLAALQGTPALAPASAAVLKGKPCQT